MINLSLISRFFDNRNEGIGNYSNMHLKGLRKQKNINLNVISQDKSFFNGNRLLDYIYFFSLELPFFLPESDVYHALSPIESIRLDTSKSVVNIHGLMLIKIPHLIYKNKLLSYQPKLFFNLSMKSALKCEKIVTISEESAKYISEFYSVDYYDIFIVRQRISDGLFCKKLEKETYNIVTISNVSYRKRIDILIKNFLKADINNSKLFIGGKGPQLTYLKNLANNDERVIFLGFISDSEINEFYNSLDVFVFPSFMEGYGLPMVEAMACCKPVVTLDDAFIPYDIKKITHISSKEDLVNTLKNRSFDCDIKSNLKFAKEHSIENMANNMVNIYNDI